MQLVGGRHNSGDGDAPLEEAMVAALHKYINEHRRGRRPAAEEPVSSAARRLARGQAAMAAQRRPAAVQKPGVGAAVGTAAQPKQSGKLPRQDGDDQAADGADVRGKQRKPRAKRKATNGATTAAGHPSSEEGGGDSETEAELQADKRAKGKKKLKPRAKGSAAEAIGNVALGDGGSGVLERGASGAGASEDSYGCNSLLSMFGLGDWAPHAGSKHFTRCAVFQARTAGDGARATRSSSGSWRWR